MQQVDDIYEPIKAIGRGAYGVVCSARNKRTGDKVAIKKVGNIFGNLVDARRALREVRRFWCTCYVCGPASGHTASHHVLYMALPSSLHALLCRCSSPRRQCHDKSCCCAGKVV